MRPIGQWRHQMSSTVTIEPRLRVTSTGPVYGAAVAYPAHLSRLRRLVRNAAGEEVVSEQAIYLGTADAVEETARVTLSSSDSSHVHPVIVAVARAFDAQGPHHTILYCGGG